MCDTTGPPPLDSENLSSQDQPVHQLFTAVERSEDFAKLNPTHAPDVLHGARGHSILYHEVRVMTLCFRIFLEVRYGRQDQMVFVLSNV